VIRRSPIRRVAASRFGLTAAERLEMDDLARAVVMVRAGASYEPGPKSLRWFGPCECCEKSGPLDWSHILGRAEAPRLVWVPENAMAQVRGCHWKWTEHKNWASGKSFRDQALAVVLHRRVPCDFAQTWDGYRDRLVALSRGRGKVDHGAQRAANTLWLKTRAPVVLRDLAQVWAER
jgi:hypothetical protein